MATVSPLRPAAAANATAADAPTAGAPVGAAAARPATPPDLLTLLPWEDPSVDASGLDPRSRYVELFWLPVLGPSATWLLRRMADHLDVGPDRAALDLAATAGSLGLGGPKSRHAPLDRALGRCARFGMVRPAGPGIVAVRRRVAHLPHHLVARLPPHLQLEHRRWERPAPSAGDVRRRARLLAVDLRSLDDDRSGIERRLLRAGVHPALAYDAAGWVLDPAGPTAPSAP